MKISFVVLCVGLIGLTNAHGFLKVPAARNCMWRYGFDNPKNYNDNELFCGGRLVMHRKNGGRCGVCGDPWDTKIQPHMDGGRYANDIITKTYKQGQVIDVEVLLTISHKGHFEFRVGNFTNKKTSGNEIGKLNGELLKIVGGQGGTTFPVPKSGKYTYKVKLQLPKGLTCKRCVFQWWYQGDNNWNGKEQGRFVNCADITITR